MAIRIIQDTLGPSLAAASVAHHAKAHAVINTYAPRVESHAKMTAPWQDQTGNARQGLKARAGSRPGEYWIDLMHSMPYGIWLEVRWSGRFAVIMPTILRMAPEVHKGIGRAILGIGGGR